MRVLIHGASGLVCTKLVEAELEKFVAAFPKDDAPKSAPA